MAIGERAGDGSRGEPPEVGYGIVSIIIPSPLHAKCGRAYRRLHGDTHQPVATVLMIEGVIIPKLERERDTKPASYHLRPTRDQGSHCRCQLLHVLPESGAFLHGHIGLLQRLPDLLDVRHDHVRLHLAIGDSLKDSLAGRSLGNKLGLRWQDSLAKCQLQVVQDSPE